MTADSHFSSDSTDLIGTIRGGTFVGRQREMGGLRAALDDAISGRGGIAMLVGEPGIGKTRTAQELAVYGEQAGVQVLWGRCFEGEGAPPFWPWVQVLRSCVQQQDPDQLRSHLGTSAADIAEVIPLVREKLPGLEPPPALEPEQARFRLFDSITTFLKNASQAQPLMLVLDDLHWADQPSLLLLQFLAQQLSESRLLVLGCYRDVELSRQHPLSETLAELSREPLFQRVLLHGLSQDDTQEFVKAAHGVVPSRGLLEAIHGHTEGNPFFMSEVVRLMGDQGGLHKRGPAGLADLQIPEGVREVIGQRLNRRTEECNQVLTLASVIGREFSLEQLSLLWESVSDERLLEVVEEALTARLVEEVPDSATSYRFCHALIQETLLSELSSARRARLHRRIGEALEGLYGPDAAAHAAELAHHFAQAGTATDAEKLARYSLLAGEQALTTYAYGEALEHFQRGLAAKRVPLDGNCPASDAEAAALLFGLGRAQAVTSERYHTQEAFDALSRAFDFYATMGDVELAVAVAEYPGYSMVHQPGLAQMQRRALALVLPDSHEAGRILSAYGRVLADYESDYSGAKEALARALAIARRVGDTALEMRTLANSGDNMHLHYQESLGYCLKAIELAVRIGALQTEVGARYAAVTDLTSMGDLAGAHQHNIALLAQAERLRDRFWLGAALWKNAIEYRLQGDWQTARQFSDRGLSISPRDMSLLSDRVQLEFWAGDCEPGEHYLKRVLELTDQAPPRPTALYANPAMVIPIIGRISGNFGRSDIAESAARTVLSSPTAVPAMALRARIGLSLLAVERMDIQAARDQYAALNPHQGLMLIWAISADRLLGLLAQTMDNLEQAMTHFEDALTFCRKAGYWPELAWTCHDYADALLQRKGSGDCCKATELLDEAQSISSELGTRPLLERVIGLKERLELQPASAQAYPDGLTQREVEVLRLIAGGKNNSEVAEELVLSIRTVERHISNIYTKINARGRADATAYALSNGLAR